MRWPAPTLLLALRRLATRSPGRVLSTSRQFSSPRISYGLQGARDYAHAAIEVHSVDPDCRIIFDAQIDVFANTKTEIASLREVSLAELVFLDF